MAGINFNLKVDGALRTSNVLRRFSGQLKDRRTANRAVSVALYNWVIRNFDSEGSLVGGWTPLAESTKRHKEKIGKEKMLVISGALRAHNLPFSDNDRAGVGNELLYSRFHQLGKGRVPKREILPRTKDAEQIGIQVYQFYIAKYTTEANS